MTEVGEALFTAYLLNNGQACLEQPRAYRGFSSAAETEVSEHNLSSVVARGPRHRAAGPSPGAAEIQACDGRRVGVPKIRWAGRPQTREGQIAVVRRAVGGTVDALDVGWGDD